MDVNPQELFYPLWMHVPLCEWNTIAPLGRLSDTLGHTFSVLCFLPRNKYYFRNHQNLNMYLKNSDFPEEAPFQTVIKIAWPLFSQPSFPLLFLSMDLVTLSQRSPVLMLWGIWSSLEFWLSFHSSCLCFFSLPSSQTYVCDPSCVFAQ